VAAVGIDSIMISVFTDFFSSGFDASSTFAGIVGALA